MKMIRNFILSNLCLTAVLLFFLDCLPSRFVVEIDTQHDMVVRLLNGPNKIASYTHYASEDSAGEKVISNLHCRLYIPTGLDLNDLHLEFLGKDWRLNKVCIEKWCILRFEVNPNNFTKSRFLGMADRRFWFVLALLEFVLLVLAVFSANKVKAGLSRSQLVDCSLVGLLGAFIFCLAAPIQSFLVNQSIFDFGLNELLLDLLVRMVLLWFGFVGILCMMTLCYGSVINRIAFACIVACFLEMGVLSIGFPSINGNIEFFNNNIRTLLDTSVWCCVILLFVWKWIDRWLRYGVLIVSILTCASLFDTKIEPRPSLEHLCTSKFASNVEIAKSVFYSPTNNIIVCVLDSITCKQALEAINDSSANLKEKFRGFVGYSDNVGMGYNTAYASAGMLTGEWAANPFATADYFYSIFSDKSVLKDALDSGRNVFFMPGSFSFGYTSCVLSANNSEKSESPFERRIRDSLRWSLKEIVLFRLLPFGIKAPFFNFIYKAWDKGIFGFNEDVMYPILIKAPIVRQDKKGVFLYLHTGGTHIPVDVDRYGNQMSVHDNSFRGRVEKSIYLFGELSQVFARLEADGIYDNSFIVITSDHGPHVDWSYDRSDLFPEKGRPFLFIKARGAKNPFVVNDIPVTHKNLADVLRRELHGEVLSINRISEIMKSEDRSFMSDENGLRRVWTLRKDGCVEYREIRFEEIDCQGKLLDQ